MELSKRPIEKLVDALGIEGSWFADDVIEQAAARLRNSIPKPKDIHVVVYDGVNLVIDGKYVCDLSDRYSRHADYRRDAEQRLRTALGINDTEGGE